MYQKKRDRFLSYLMACLQTTQLLYMYKHYDTISRLLYRAFLTWRLNVKSFGVETRGVQRTIRKGVHFSQHGKLNLYSTVKSYHYQSHSWSTDFFCLALEFFYCKMCQEKRPVLQVILSYSKAWCFQTISYPIPFLCICRLSKKRLCFVMNESDVDSESDTSSLSRPQNSFLSYGTFSNSSISGMSNWEGNVRYEHSINHSLIPAMTSSVRKVRPHPRARQKQSFFYRATWARYKWFRLGDWFWWSSW